MSALTLLCGATDVVRRLIVGDPVDAAASGLSARERRKLAAVLGKSDLPGREMGRES